MASRGGPDLNNYLGSEVTIETTLQKNFTGILRGFDEHMNCTVDNLQERDGDNKPVGSVFEQGVVRGKTIVSIESASNIEARR